MKRYVGIVFIAIGCLVVVGCAPGYFIIDRYPSFGRRAVSPSILTRSGGWRRPVTVSFPRRYGLWSWRAGFTGVVHHGRRADATKVPFDFVAYQVVYPDKTVIIDSRHATRMPIDRIPAPMRVLILRSFNETNYDPSSRSR